MTCHLHQSFETSGIELSALRNHIPCMANVIQWALGAFLSNPGVKCCTKLWEAHEMNQQFGWNECIDIGKSQSLHKEGNTRINMVSAMRPGLAKIIEKVHISWYFESPATYLDIAENACGIDYTDTLSPKQVHWLSRSQCPHCSTPDYGCEAKLELNTGVAQVTLPIRAIHTPVAPKSKIHGSPATFHNSRWMDNCEVCHGRFEHSSKLDPVDVDEAYSHIASRHGSVQWEVRSSGQRDASFGYAEDAVEGRLVLGCEVSSTEALQILHWNDSNDRHAFHLYTYPRFFLEFTMVSKVKQVSAYQSRGGDILYYPLSRGHSVETGGWILC